MPRHKRQNVRTIMLPCEQSVIIDYPIMAYKGFAPDNREIILANLADEEHPQKIIHLYEKQFICFVGHNFADREAKIGFLVREDEEIKLCWLVCIQPFEKKEFDIYEDYEITECPINFNRSILDNIQGIRRAEYVRYENQTNE